MVCFRIRRHSIDKDLAMNRATWGVRAPQKPQRRPFNRYRILFIKRRGKRPLLQVDGLIMPRLVELCTPHLVHTLVLGTTERDGRSKPNVEIAEIFESSYQFLGVELRATTL